jgi:hypothetical protein
MKVSRPFCSIDTLPAVGLTTSPSTETVFDAFMKPQDFRFSVCRGLFTKTSRQTD